VTIITISRGSYSKGKEIAEKVAERLGFRLSSRDVLLEASEEFNIPEVKLVRALHDAPSILGRFTYGRERYVAFIRKAFLDHVREGKVVYHGLAGQFFVRGVDHVLKTRIIADCEDRVRLEMEREGIDQQTALKILKKDDAERRKWSMSLYGIDTTDPLLYDLVLHIRKFSVEDAVDLICHAAKMPHFAPTPESRKALDDLVLAATVKVAIVKDWPHVQVAADDGRVVIHAKATLVQEDAIASQITALVEKVPGVKEVRVGVRPILEA